MKAQTKERKPSRAARAAEAPVNEEMVTRYLPLVRFVAEKVHRRLPPGVDLESLVHSGVVGLLEALKRYDPKRGVDFEVYARYRIQGEVMQCLRSLDWVSRSVRSWGRKIDATSLEQPIKVRPKQAAARRVQISEERRIPWVAIGLAALIAVAAGVVLVAAGIVKLPA